MINDHLSISSPGFHLLQAIETLRCMPYDDQTGQTIQHWCQGATIGYGHLIAEQDWYRFRNGIDIGEAIDLLAEDLQRFEQAIRRAVIVSLSQRQFDALVIFAFNIGVKNLIQSSVVKLINNPRAVTRYATLEIAWKAWNKSQGHVNNGLVNRRKCEWAIYRNGLYEKW